MSYELHKRFFEQAVTDRSGYLTLQKLIAFLRKNGYTGKDSKAKALFNAIDVYGKGEVTLNEYLIAMGEIPTTFQKGWVLRACFQSFDKDNDKRINSEDLDEVFREMGKVYPMKEVERIIAMSDKNRDGKLDYEEFFGKKHAIGYHDSSERAIYGQRTLIG